ncbi:glycerate kinase [Mumia sp. zg.B53]|uniref:glycerate kinase n=2 Tax=Mumia TaxID=1546255 RepID=UPI001C6ED92F|nr:MULTISPECIES: glycerate kinase [unclassified Mumia]MBW9209086.1 glycerate kinase [Mumia sp. zg.B21]MBW9213697.1 glycerate kinase [Mumia sp. zg.B53]
MTRVVVAPDKFKGSLDAAGVAAALARGMRRSDVEVVELPVADGGDGTVAAALASGWRPVPVTVAGPTGTPVSTTIARRGDQAVVEMADACGLVRLDGPPAPMTASSRGLGEAVAAAIADGASQVVVGIGGSASTDGGAGMLSALGARLLDSEGALVPEGGVGLAEVASVDLDGLRLGGTTLVVACDVDNPLTGPHGAAAVYAPQKGARPGQIEVLDRGLSRWADVVASVTGRDLRQVPGAGAAGGVGFAALSVLGAETRSGAELVLDLVGLDAALAGADLVVTGEGSFDEQTLRGKAPAVVAARAARQGVPVVVVCGRTTLSETQARQAGFAGVHALQELEADLERCIAEAPALLQRAGAAAIAAWIGV